MRRSHTGYFLLLGGTLITWKSKKQSVVSPSSTEEEYRAMASTLSEILWVRWLLSELQVNTSSPKPLLCDNQGARHIENNMVFQESTKHAKWNITLNLNVLNQRRLFPCTSVEKCK